MTETYPEKLVKYVRDGLIEQEHFGFIVMSNKKEIINTIGETNSYPFYLRSCAKPLQASLLIDLNMDKFFNMTEGEIALCCASHAGEKIHIETAKELLQKIGLKPNALKCGLHKPLSKTEQEKLILNKTTENIFHNNCCGKHIMMLGLCVINNWDLSTYDDINHPLQKLIKRRIYDLCEIKQDYPVTFDGCGVPIYAMPLANMVKGYLNLFCNPVYEKLRNAFLYNPYIIGGEDRTDTKIIQASTDIVAKTGAGGLCIVVNTRVNKGFVVKICDGDMKAREIVVIDILRQLRWADIPVDNSIKTIHGKIVGEILCTQQLSQLK